MVNPIASSLAGALYGQAQPANVQATQAPEPAVQVTGTAAAQLGGNAAQSQFAGNGNGGQGEQPPADAIENLNKRLEAWSTGIRFEMNDEAQRMVVSIVDKETGDVIRQVPSEAVLQVAKMIVQMQGSSIDTKA